VSLDRRKSSSLSVLGDLNSGRAFDTGCQCVLQDSPASRPVLLVPPRCSCSAPRLAAQHAFVATLGNICNKLLRHSSKELRTAQLYAEISQLNLNLPARVCVPLFGSRHQVLRVPGSEAVVLNSKSKAPYLLHIEVAECRDTYLSPLPAKQLDVTVQSLGPSSRLPEGCVRSEGTSPSGMRAASLPCLTETQTCARVSRKPCLLSVYSIQHSVYHFLSV
jgi:phosphatidylinositol 4-kinase